MRSPVAFMELITELLAQRIVHGNPAEPPTSLSLSEQNAGPASVTGLAC
jgi:hypothetical protein